MNLADIRIDYHKGKLRRRDLLTDPLDQFRLWLEQAEAAGVIEPTAMSLATAGADGRPLLRTVLLKGLAGGRFLFFTNFESRKGRHIAENPAVSLLFPWLAMERQVIVTGIATRLPDAESLAYFHSRPRGSQLAAWASRQSSPIVSREALEEELAKIEGKFGTDTGPEGAAPLEPIPLPPFWGGYSVAPDAIQFWQGGSHRLHDRFEYTRRQAEAKEAEGAAWKVERLSP